MKNFKSFVTTRSLDEATAQTVYNEYDSGPVHGPMTFYKLLYTALTNGKLSSKKGYSYLFGLIDAAGFSKLDMDTVDERFNAFVDYFTTKFRILDNISGQYIFHEFDQLKSLSKTNKIHKTIYDGAQKIKDEISKIWASIVADAVELKKEDPSAGYIVPSADFATAIINLLSKGENDPDVEFFTASKLTHSKESSSS